MAEIKKGDILAGEKDWDQFWSGEKTKQSAQISWSKRRILSVISPYLERDMQVLDAGSGSGFFSRYFCERGLNVFSLDYSQEALQMTRQMTEGRSTLLCQDLLSSCLSEQIKERFDLIFSDGLLEHFGSQQQDQILTNFNQLLITDGIIVTFVPNKWSPWQIIRPFYMPGIKESPFVLKELIALHKNNHLEPIASGGINVWPFPLSPDKFLGQLWGMLLFVIARKEH